MTHPLLVFQERKSASRPAGFEILTPPGVPPDLKSGVKKCPNLFMLCGFAIRSKGVYFSPYWSYIQQPNIV